MKHFDCDVVVIGGGHAGTEAACAAARLGVNVILVTMKESDIGALSCNPAIGGLGKGHLVREIDAMDGIMGKVADASGIQFRLLNRRKGPAVQGPRAQVDRVLYAQHTRRVLHETEDLIIVFGEVAQILHDNQRVAGVELADGTKIQSKAVVLTTGTFLRGVIHVGHTAKSGGRVGDKASNTLASQINALGVTLGRLKTGTPPRLDGRTINWSALDVQDGDADPVFFSFATRSVEAKQVPCHITHTNTVTHQIIQDNLEASAMYGGQIDGVGPRYCPSIEDKVVRFADKDSHQIFLEPESLSGHVIYPNGISTSLPAEIQEQYVRSIVGLENTEILQPGYAIEYDFVDPRQLDLTLQLPKLDGFFLAGQINGTTGYEEAAAQGLVAGLNAARQVTGSEPVIFSRTSSYIGVLVDDLSTRGVTEPYRMFTSRAEYRLHLRADNADQRLTPLGIEIGSVQSLRAAAFAQKSRLLEKARKTVSQTVLGRKDYEKLGVPVGEGAPKALSQILSMKNVDWTDVCRVCPDLASVDDSIGAQIKREAIYANYLERQFKDAEALKRDEDVVIPAGFDFLSIGSLSNEIKAKLQETRPSNLAQAARIDGMTPAALTTILAAIRKNQVKKSA